MYRFKTNITKGRVSYYLKALLTILLFLTQISLILGNGITANPPDIFKINDFTVLVTEIKKIPDRFTPRIENGNAEKINGEGYLIISGNRINVDFNVRLIWDKDQSSLVATSGQVTGNEREKISYKRGIFKITLHGERLKITPTEATCRANVAFRSEWFSTTDTQILLTSKKCEFNAGGSISGSNFTSSGTFQLKSTDYNITLAENATHVVRIENFPVRPQHERFPVNGRYLDRPDNNEIRQSVIESIFPERIEKPFEGVILNGGANYRYITTYRHNCSITETGESRFAIYLTDEVERQLEYGSNNTDGYDLLLKSGIINIHFRETEMISFEGKYNCDIKLPGSIIHAQNPQGRINLENQTVYSDQYGTLSNYINLYDRDSIPISIKAGNSNLLLTSVDTGAFLYLPKWASGGSGIYLKNGRCDDLKVALDNGFPADMDPRNNIFQRPGLTLHSGMLYLFSKQVDCDNNPGEDTIKAHYKSNLTCTPYGLTGSISTPGSSFIPAKLHDTLSFMHETFLNPTWEEVLDAGEERPVSPKERFKLEGLSILEMQLDRMNICLNELETSMFKYLVHFPFPSFMNIAFNDTSYNGKSFLSASGPEESYYWETPAIYPNDTVVYNLPPRIKDKSNIPKPNPQTIILWAWRLPVTFAAHTINIDFTALREEEDNAISVRMDTNRLDNMGDFQNSELWIPSLYSKKSSLKCGVRFDANISGKGDIKIVKWDEYPYFGSSNHKKFDIYLSAFEKVDYNTDPVQRDDDFQWTGKIKLPFFNKDDVGSWTDLKMKIKDFIPEMESPMQLAMTSYKKRTCCNASGEEFPCGNDDSPNPPIRIGIKALHYSHERNNFYSTDYIAYEKAIYTEDKLFPGSITINSYTDAILYPVANSSQGEFEISRSNECGNQVREFLKNYRSSETIKDLVCYDALALIERIQQGQTKTCCNLYYMGDYVVTSNDEIVFYAEDARYYPWGDGKLQFVSSSAKIYSEDSGEEIKMNIPGAFIEYSADGKLKASFGATLTSMASSLPYEAEFRFMMDPQCGYFYFMGAGSFTYILRFTGLVFIVHAPFDYLQETETQYYSSILESMRVRTLHHDQADFMSAMQFDGLGEETVITGCFLAGGASSPFGFEGLNLGLALGTGTYFFQFRDPDGAVTFRSGIFMNAQAEVDLFLLMVRAYLELRAAAGISQNSGSYTQMIEESELELQGILGIEGCVSVLVGHCSANAKVGVSVSSREGFSFEGTDISAECDWGGCPD